MADAPAPKADELIAGCVRVAAYRRREVGGRLSARSGALIISADRDRGRPSCGGGLPDGDGLVAGDKGVLADADQTGARRGIVIAADEVVVRADGIVVAADEIVVASYGISIAHNLIVVAGDRSYDGAVAVADDGVVVTGNIVVVPENPISVAVDRDGVANHAIVGAAVDDINAIAEDGVVASRAGVVVCTNGHIVGAPCRRGCTDGYGLRAERLSRRRRAVEDAVLISADCDGALSLSIRSDADGRSGKAGICEHAKARTPLL